MGRQVIRFHKGQVVKTTELALERRIFREHKRGMVVSNPRTPLHVRIQLEGKKTAATYAAELWEPDQEAEAPRDPETARQWQEAVDIATALLYLEAARRYGLIDSDSHVDAGRCQEVLLRGKEQGVTPARDLLRHFTELQAESPRPSDPHDS